MDKYINFLNKNYFIIFTTFIYIFFLIYFFKSFSYDYQNSYAFRELFLNYQGGFVRRGLLGEIFIQLNKIFFISPLVFFSSVLFLVHSLNLFFFYKIIKKTELPIEIGVILFFSPALLFFSIYDFNMFFIKDVFIKFLILLHAFVVIKTRKNINEYLKYFKFLIIPLIFFTNLFIHEYGVFFISVHLLISLYAFEYKKNFFFLIYLSLSILIILFILINVGDEITYSKINQSIQQFGVSIHKQLAGGFKSLIGGFYKWHFFYFSYKDFFMLLMSFLLSIWIFYFIFNSFIINKIFIYKIKYNYLIFFFPTFLTFLNLDHGRNISLLSFHLVAFYLILNINFIKLRTFIKKIKINFYFFNLIYLFIFFYLFMWTLPQDAGFGGRDQINTIFRGSLFTEFKKFVNFLYFFISDYVISLPEIKL